MHPEILSMALFWIVAAYTPGPNNVIASYSGFNFGIKKTLPHILGVAFGFTFLIFLLTIGLVNIFKIFPVIQVSLSSITFWTFVGKYLRKFATNEKFIKYFNCAMSLLLILSIITFYI